MSRYRINYTHGRTHDQHRNVKPNTHRRRDASHVGGVNTPVGSRDQSLQFPVLASDDIITSLLKVIKIHEYYTTQLIRMFTNMQRTSLSYFYSIGCRIVNLVTAIGCVHVAESVGSRRELVANSCRHRQRDATRQLSRVGVGGVY